MLQSLPKIVKQRIKALKNIQLKATHIEADFYKEVQALECKYHKLYTPLYDQVSSSWSGLLTGMVSARGVLMARWRQWAGQAVFDYVGTLNVRF